MRALLPLIAVVALSSPAAAQPPPPLEDVVILDEVYWIQPEIGSIFPVWPNWPNGVSADLGVGVILDVFPSGPQTTYFVFVYDEDVGSWQPMNAVNGITGSTHITGSAPGYSFGWAYTIPEYGPWWYSVTNGNPVAVYYEAWRNGQVVDTGGNLIW
jgi:hypothetical protein